MLNTCPAVDVLVFVGSENNWAVDDPGFVVTISVIFVGVPDTLFINTFVVELYVV